MGLKKVLLLLGGGIITVFLFLVAASLGSKPRLTSVTPVYSATYPTDSLQALDSAQAYLQKK